ncbi:MAG: hypothetical protein PUB69_05325 [Desulfovibrionaceae bacterium]|nr:hypothetical protein [Desulfovibrionaceae bacterium]
MELAKHHIPPGRIIVFWIAEPPWGLTCRVPSMVQIRVLNEMRNIIMAFRG